MPKTIANGAARIPRIGTTLVMLGMSDPRASHCAVIARHGREARRQPYEHRRAGAYAKNDRSNRAVLEALMSQVPAAQGRRPGAVRWMCRMCETQARAAGLRPVANALARAQAGREQGHTRPGR